jgi:hypothetical protein
MEKIGTGAPVSKADEIPQASPLSNTPPNSNFEHPQQSMPVQSASPLSGAKPLKAAEHINPAATIPAAKETVPANVIPTAKPVSSAAPIQSTNLVKPAEPLSATDSVLPTIDNSVDASSINFSKPRSAEIYQKLCSTNPADWEKAVKDLPFILGDDQMILLEKAIQSTSDAVRLAAVKILSRKRNPGVRELLEKVKDDSCQPISSLVQKALLLHK